MMRITFITGHLCKERHALLHELALDLGEHGAKVTVLTGFPSRRISEDVKKYYLEHPVEQLSKNVLVRRIGSRDGEGEGLFERMLKYLKLTIDLYKEAKNTPTDAYYIYSSPPFLGWMGIALAKFAPTLYNAQDIFPDTLIRIKKLKKYNPLVIALRMMERLTYRGNTRIVTISEEMKNTLVLRGCPKDKIDVIYNWADTENLWHVDRSDNLLMDELKIGKNNFLVSYAGDIGLFQGWPFIIDAAQKVHEVNESIQFVIIGSGSYKKTLEQKVKNERLDYISIYPLQSSSRLPEIYSIGDLELVSLAPGLSAIALPSKIFVIMATASPMLLLVDQDSTMAKMVHEHDLGFSVTHGDSSKLADTILSAYATRDILSQKGKNAKTWIKLNASRKNQTKKYYTALKDLVYEKGRTSHA